MNEIIIDKKEEIVMKLLHYFITEKGYNPVIVRGVKDEIWLENLDEDYSIIRIVSSYIHNDEQFKFDLFKTKTLIKSIKRKTFSLKLKALSIFVNLGENVDVNSFEEKNINFANIKKTSDLKKYYFVIDAFPDITKDTNFKEKGLDLFLKITDDINKKNEEEAKITEDIFKAKKPIVTYAIIAISIVIFILDILLNNKLIFKFAINRYYILNGEYYRLLTGVFLHAGIMHLIFNMYSLYIIGSQLESFLGKTKYIIVYLLSGIAGSVLSIFFNSNYSVGASGAIFGLLGSLLYFGYHYRVYLDTVIKSQIIPLILLNLSIGFIVPGIDNWAHIGGLIGGIFSSMAVGLKHKTTKIEQINGAILYTIYTAFIMYFVFFKLK
ncbi:MAG: rhomboid family intramembrane serine protease [Bacilli bacterium]|nr:rhomboid family intramembrane serine protease [Bacilli bacterium]MBR3209232.1 rhomboid family intramembrane serine protease [Bacilli bacterium]